MAQVSAQTISPQERSGVLETGLALLQQVNLQQQAEREAEEANRAALAEIEANQQRLRAAEEVSERLRASQVAIPEVGQIMMAAAAANAGAPPGSEAYLMAPPEAYVEELNAEFGANTLDVSTLTRKEFNRLSVEDKIAASKALAAVWEVPIPKYPKDFRKDGMPKETTNRSWYLKYADLLRG
jgi:hypothetical protein